MLCIIWFSATLGARFYYTHLTDRQILQNQTAKRWHSWDFHPGLLESELQTFPTTPCWIQSLSYVLAKLPKLQMFGSLDISNKCRRYWGCSGIPAGWTKSKPPSNLFCRTHLAKLLSAVMAVTYEAPVCPELSLQQIWTFRTVPPEAALRSLQTIACQAGELWAKQLML